MVSVILTFYDPMNHGAMDIHAWLELFGKAPKLFPNQQHLLRVLDWLRRIRRIHRLAGREVGIGPPRTITKNEWALLPILYELNRAIGLTKGMFSSTFLRIRRLCRIAPGSREVCI